MKIKNYPIIRLWGKIASVRSTIVQSCLETDTTLRLIHHNQVMTLTPHDLRNKGFRTNKKEFKSKVIPGQTYHLIDYTFKEDDNAGKVLGNRDSVRKTQGETLEGSS